MQALQHAGKEVRQHITECREGKQGKEALRAVLHEVLPGDELSLSSWKIWVSLWYHAEANEDLRLEQKQLYREWLSRVGYSVS